jgi:hypothetical protein
VKQRRGIRSIIIRAGIFLLLVSGGAIVNIAVAWLVVFVVGTNLQLLEIPVIGKSRLESPYTHLSIELERGFGSARITSHAYGPYYPRIMDVSDLEDRDAFEIIPAWARRVYRPPSDFDPAHAVSKSSVIEARGVPCLALCGLAEHEAWQAPGTPTATRYAVVVKSPWGSGRPVSAWSRVIWPDQSLLPFRPLWPGFAINTLFYAAILWLLFAAPFALRRWRRIKRGLCPACAYPVGASDLCTECGNRIPSR